MNNQIVPTHILQAIVNYLETKPYAEVRSLLENLLATTKPEPRTETEPVAEESTLPDTVLEPETFFSAIPQDEAAPF